MGKIEKVIETARLIKSLQELGEVLQKAHHPDIVAGVRVPKQLHEHDEPVPHEHPHRELAAKFVLDVHRKNKFEGARMSEKYLGIGEGGKILHPNALHPDQRPKRYAEIGDDVKKSKRILNQLKNMPKPNLPKSELDKKSVNVQPAMVSSPLIVNPAGMPIDEKKVSNSPAVMNPYKMDKNGGADKVSKLLSSLKGRK